RGANLPSASSSSGEPGASAPESVTLASASCTRGADAPGSPRPKADSKSAPREASRRQRRRAGGSLQVGAAQFEVGVLLVLVADVDLRRQLVGAERLVLREAQLARVVVLVHVRLDADQLALRPALVRVVLQREVPLARDARVLRPQHLA